MWRSIPVVPKNVPASPHTPGNGGVPILFREVGEGRLTGQECGLWSHHWGRDLSFSQATCSQFTSLSFRGDVRTGISCRHLLPRWSEGLLKPVWIKAFSIMLDTVLNGRQL